MTLLTTAKPPLAEGRCPMSDESQNGKPVRGQHDTDLVKHMRDGSLPIGAFPAPPDTTAPGERSDVLQRFWEAVKRLPAYIRLATSLARDPEVPKQAKAILAAGGGYVISPIDFVPGIIPVAGQLDDVYVLLTLIRQALKRTPNEVAERHMATARIGYDDIDGDLQAVRDLVRVAVVKTVVFGGKALGRVSRAAIGFANEQRKHWSTGRTEGPE